MSTLVSRVHAVLAATVASAVVTAALGIAAPAARADGGPAWWSLGSPTAGVNQPVNVVLQGTDGNIYLIGSFSQASGTTISRPAKWNPTTQTWSSLGSGLAGGTFTKMAQGPDGSLYVGGAISSAGGITVSNIAKWDGSTWSALAGGIPSNATALIATSTGVYASYTGSGIGHVAKWDGSSWSQVGGNFTGLTGFVSALAEDSRGVLYAAGTFTFNGSTPIQRIAQFVNGAWQSVGSGADSSINALTVDSSNNLYAVGTFTNIDGVSASRIAKYTLTSQTWSQVGPGLLDAPKAIAIDSSSTIYVAGSFVTVPGGTTVNGITRLNESTGQWEALGSGFYRSSLMDGRSIAFASDGSVYVGGYFSNIGNSAGTAVNNVARWGRTDQSIAFTDPGTQNFGTSPTLTASATSGLPVSWSSTSTPVCTIDAAGTLALLSAGTCSITASQAGDATYFAATPVSQSFTVSAVVPSALTTLTSSSVTQTTAAVTFTSASDGGSPITNIEYSIDNGVNWLTPSPAITTSPLELTGLTAGTAYAVRLRAVNAVGAGAASAALSLTTSSPPSSGGGAGGSGSNASAPTVPSSSSTNTSTSQQPEVSETVTPRVPSTTTRHLVVVFPLGSSRIDESQDTRLRQFADSLPEGSTVVASGAYASTRHGKVRSALALERARAVARELERAGIKSVDVTTHPIKPKGVARDRRVTVIATIPQQ